MPATGMLSIATRVHHFRFRVKKSMTPLAIVNAPIEAANAASKITIQTKFIRSDYPRYPLPFGRVS